MRSRRERVRGVTFVATAVISAVAMSACMGKPFDVKTVPRVDPGAIGPAARLDGLSVRAEAIWDENWLLEVFDANLILAGVLPVRVDLENPGANPLDVRKLKLEVTDADGSRFKRLDPKKARKTIEGYYGITIRNKTGDEIYKADFQATALDLKTALAPGEHRQGFVFFAFPKSAPRRPVTATLAVDSKDGAARVPLPAAK
jgi:hypothetical protein